MCYMNGIAPPSVLSFEMTKLSNPDGFELAFLTNPQVVTKF